MKAFVLRICSVIVISIGQDSCLQNKFHVCTSLICGHRHVFAIPEMFARQHISSKLQEEQHSVSWTGGSTISPRCAASEISTCHQRLREGHSILLCARQFGLREANGPTEPETWKKLKVKQLAKN